MEVETVSTNDTSKISEPESFIKELDDLFRPRDSPNFLEAKSPKVDPTDLEEYILKQLDKNFQRISDDQQKRFGVDGYYCTDKACAYLVPQNFAKPLFDCFARNRFKMKKYIRFAVFGRLSKDRSFSQHKFYIWPDTEENPIFEIDIKVPTIYYEISPGTLFLRNMKRYHLRSHQYYLFFLGPKAPAPRNVQEKKVDINLIGAVEMKDVLKEREFFENIPFLQKMIDSNEETISISEYLYPISECQTIKEQLSRNEKPIVPKFEDNASSNQKRNVAQNITVLANKREERDEYFTHQDRQELLGYPSEIEEQGRGDDGDPSRQNNTNGQGGDGDGDGDGISSQQGSINAQGFGAPSYHSSDYDHWSSCTSAQSVLHGMFS